LLSKQRKFSAEFKAKLVLGEIGVCLPARIWNR